MGLSGLQIYKLLPKTNCKECGFPTCLAFAMKLAAKQAELSACPYVSEEAKAALAAASAPPIRLITISSDERKVEVGNETVMFRHEKTFYHPPGLMIRLKDTLPLEELKELANEVADYSVERVGMELTVDGFALENASGDAAAFARAVEALFEVAQRPLILISRDAAAMEAALAKLDGAVPLLYAADEDNWQAMAELAKKYKVPLAVRGENGDLTQLANLVQRVRDAGVQDIVLDPGTRDPADSLISMTLLRRLALKKNFRLLGYPIIAFPGEGAESEAEEAALAAQHIAKYGGFIVLDHFDPATIYPLLTLRLNIYTDPQKPIQVSPGIYEFHNPTPESPLLTTTNFSLTYFTVAGEVEGSGVPAWLLIVDTEGMSVLTGWAAGKFDAESIAKAVKTFNVEERISHRKIIIPGFVAVISGELEEELPGWEVLVGPREAINLPAYLKMWRN
ncbi:MAG TPA: acetyl-CoA decarbonylase/synthase complex subunit gamma [Anaerolineae bacterium]|nr:acetyl-CoA decarbonylase/synthase complex subunit gamma [Anaerolineae bacterium]